MQFKSTYEQLEYEFALCEEKVAVEEKLATAYLLVVEHVKRYQSDKKGIVSFLNKGYRASIERRCKAEQHSSQTLKAIGKIDRKLDRAGIINHDK